MSDSSTGGGQPVPQSTPERMPQPIPQASPGSEYAADRAALDGAIARALRSGWYILGPEVEAFEAEFAAWLGLPASVGVANGTDAIEVGLRALGVGPGDAVFTVSHTAVATVVAIERTGATPVLVDIDDETMTMDPARLADTLRSPETLGSLTPRAVVPVHLYGQAADMAAITALARQHDLLVVEDCAQAHGATLGGQMAGTFGDVACFSFYPTKNLGAVGDGGAVAARDPRVVARARELRQYGWRERYVSATTGMNSRLDELQAAVLRVKLARLDERNRRRQEIASHYDRELAATGLRLPVPVAGRGHVYHQYVVRTERRHSLEAALRARGIGTAIHYPVAVHAQPAYAGRLLQAGGLAVTERVVGEILSLPMFPLLGDDQVARVTDAVLAWADDPGGDGSAT